VMMISSSPPEPGGAANACGRPGGTTARSPPRGQTSSLTSSWTEPDRT
jgi:hypothetical protein